uniref:Swi5-dependent recombination DNA repair protein 1 homolog n=1 Tax=Gouania willdenowi TaxID=441366 RepID=A0A8C5NG40_GOUWI
MSLVKKTLFYICDGFFYVSLQPGSHLSAALKERLKRTRRSFVSPVSVAKRLCVDDTEERVGKRGLADSQQQQQHVNNPLMDRMEAGENCAGTTYRSPEDDVQPLRREVKDRTEKLRRLKMVKMYRSKNDLKQLQTLVDKWRTCAQAALVELQLEVLIDGRQAHLSELMDHFGLDDNILHFDRTREDFT